MIEVIEDKYIRYLFHYCRLTEKQSIISFSVYVTMSQLIQIRTLTV